MKITRQRLKEIILEEMNTLDIDDEEGNAPSNQGGMDEITEGEGMELVQQVAQTLFDSGVTAAESPQELALALKGLGKFALTLLGGGALATAGIAGKDAIDKLARDTDGPDTPSQALEEDGDNTLEGLIKQAVQEHIDQLTVKTVE